MYHEHKHGKTVLPLDKLAMVALLQAALGMSDEDAVESAAMDKKWQVLLGTLYQENAPFSQGSLFNFRQRLMANYAIPTLHPRTEEAWPFILKNSFGQNCVSFSYPMKE